jgi:hypothetical protein
MPLTSPTCGGRSVGIVRLRTKATEYIEFQKYTHATPEMSRLNNRLQLDSICIKQALKCIQMHHRMSKFGEPNIALHKMSNLNNVRTGTKCIKHSP